MEPLVTNHQCDGDGKKVDSYDQIQCLREYSNARLANPLVISERDGSYRLSPEDSSAMPAPEEKGVTVYYVPYGSMAPQPVQRVQAREEEADDRGLSWSGRH
jgi:hypothetical protein